MSHQKTCQSLFSPTVPDSFGILFLTAENSKHILERPFGIIMPSFGTTNYLSLNLNQVGLKHLQQAEDGIVSLFLFFLTRWISMFSCPLFGRWSNLLGCFSFDWIILWQSWLRCEASTGEKGEIVGTSESSLFRSICIFGFGYRPPISDRYLLYMHVCSWRGPQIFMGAVFVSACLTDLSKVATHLRCGPRRLLLFEPPPRIHSSSSSIFYCVKTWIFGPHFFVRFFYCWCFYVRAFWSESSWWYQGVVWLSNLDRKT